jgi:hypothetical protein
MKSDSKGGMPKTDGAEPYTILRLVAQRASS